MYLQALSIGCDTTIMNSYMGRVLNRLRDAYEKGDITEARKQQVDVDDHSGGAARFHLDLIINAA